MSVVIGHGAYATVYRAGGMAVKRIERRKVNIAQLERELEVHRRLDHANIVKLHRAEWQPTTVDLYLELCDTDLGQLLRSQGALPTARVRAYLSQIVAALKYLQRCNIVHRDLKPPNILLKQDQVKLSDFGLSRELSDLAATVCGSPLYMAPEILFRQQYSSNSDLWSLGCVLYEMLHGTVPFDAGSIIELCDVIKQPVDVSRAPDDCRQLLASLLTVNVVARCTWSALYAHPWCLTETQVECTPLTPVMPLPLPTRWQKLWSSWQDCVDMLSDAKGNAPRSSVG